MTKWLWLFLAFYILVCQPALLGRMLENCNLYQLAILNAWVFFISWIISALCKTYPKNENKQDIVNKLSDNNLKDNSWASTQKIKDKEEKNIKNWIKEEKNDEDTPERVLREWVSIPKIVQPISWRQTQKKKKKKEVKWGQWLVLLITLALAVIIAWTLWEFLWCWWIAIALFLWRILYLVIGKLFDINGFYNARKLFTNWLYIILILAWIAFGVYSMQQDDKSIVSDDFSQKITSYMKWLFWSKEALQFGTWDEIYIFEWTGEVITDTWDDTLDTLIITWTINDETWVTQIETWTVENILKNDVTNTWVVKEAEPETSVQPEVKVEEPSTTSVEDSKKQVTMWEAIKSLLAWAKLSTKTNVTFLYVSRSNELYPYFKTAQEKSMIWTDTNPNKYVSCETYITLKWLREWRNVWNYTSSQIKSVYWNKATELWKLNGCKKWTYVTKANL